MTAPLDRASLCYFKPAARLAYLCVSASLVWCRTLRPPQATASLLQPSVGAGGTFRRVSCAHPGASFRDKLALYFAGLSIFYLLVETSDVHLGPPLIL